MAFRLVTRAQVQAYPPLALALPSWAQGQYHSPLADRSWAGLGSVKCRHSSSLAGWEPGPGLGGPLLPTPLKKRPWPGRRQQSQHLRRLADTEVDPPPARGAHSPSAVHPRAGDLPADPCAQVLTSMRRACSQIHNRMRNCSPAERSLQTLLLGGGRRIPGSLVPHTAAPASGTSQSHVFRRGGVWPLARLLHFPHWDPVPEPLGSVSLTSKWRLKYLPASRIAVRAQAAGDTEDVACSGSSLKSSSAPRPLLSCVQRRSRHWY